MRIFNGLAGILIIIAVGFLFFNMLDLNTSFCITIINILMLISLFMVAFSKTVQMVLSTTHIVINDVLCIRVLRKYILYFFKSGRNCWYFIHLSICYSFSVRLINYCKKYKQTINFHIIGVFNVINLFIMHFRYLLTFAAKIVKPIKV